MIINGNSLEELKKFPDNYFHSVVTDPPYGLSFMGKKWDYDVPSVELWQEVLRVLKPGGHLLSFAGSRTYHRMAVNIEDAGFDIRDQIMWVYGSGFPKSHNIGKSVDKLGQNPYGWIEFAKTYKKIVKESAFNHNDIDKHLNIKASSCYWARVDDRGGLPPRHHWEKIKEFIGLDGRYDELYDEVEREVVGLQKKAMSGWNMDGTTKFNDRDITKGTSPYEGWGTALKPAHEPIVVARKPFKGTVAANVLKYGTGGINIDGCRVGYDKEDWEKAVEKRKSFVKTGGGHQDSYVGGALKNPINTMTSIKQQGRFPANFIHDGSDEVKDLLEESSRFFYCAKASKKDRNEGLEDFEEKKYLKEGGNYGCNIGSVQKLLKEGKTLEEANLIIQRNATNKNNHPTVKPTDLMRYLVRLVTPKNGIVLDCFMGSGSTGKACALEGFEFVGIDLDKDYCEIAKARIDKAIEDKNQDEAQTELF